MIHSYLPHTEEERQEMLRALGVENAEELFCDVPQEVRLKKPLDFDLFGSLSEKEVAECMEEFVVRSRVKANWPCFLGAGAYDHYIPCTVDAVLRRSEFYTAYTQYQPEISQGYLQALWEFQSMICMITGMDVANASLYDGATAMAEAAVMSCAATRRSEIVVARAVHPHYRQVLETYARDLDLTVREVDFTEAVTPVEALTAVLSKATGSVIIQSPNFFGHIENLAELISASHSVGALFTAVCDPLSLAIFEAPGKLDADIVVGDGQPLGLPLSFGGPYVGYMATKQKLMRKMPGRIVGQTVDHNGKRGFVLTLQAREQHIRREKATSNICSNEALCALAVAVYLATVGKEGFVEVARQCYAKAHYAQHKLLKREVKMLSEKPFFQEFAVKVRDEVSEVNELLRIGGIIGGLDLEKYYPELKGYMLLCVTEKRTKDEIDRLVTGIRGA